jgi:hypothetical protein
MQGHGVIHGIEHDAPLGEKAHLGKDQRCGLGKLPEPQDFLNFHPGRLGLGHEVFMPEPGEERKVHSLRLVHFLEHEPIRIHVIETAENQDGPGPSLFNFDHNSMRELASHNHPLDPGVLRHLVLNHDRIDIPDPHAVT